MVFGYLILFDIDVVILSRLFLFSSSFNWEDRCTCVYSGSNTEDHIPSRLKDSSPYLEMWLNTVFHAWCITSLLLQLLFVAVFKDVRAQLWHILNLTSRICMGYSFHSEDTLWSALKSLKTYYIYNCLAYKHGLVLSKWKVYCTCLDLWLSSWYATSSARPGMWLQWMNVCSRNSPKTNDNSCIVFFK